MVIAGALEWGEGGLKQEDRGGSSLKNLRAAETERSTTRCLVPCATWCERLHGVRSEAQNAVRS